MPTHTDPVALLEAFYIGSKFLDESDNFVTGYARIHLTGEAAIVRETVAVADAARLHLNHDLIAGWALTLDCPYLEALVRLGNLRSLHEFFRCVYCHGASLL